MNIFLLSLNLRLCAQYHLDKHVVKMVLEAAQILCTVLWLAGGTAPYKPTNKKHPCTIWCMESLANWNFLKELCFELNEEFKFRYRKEVDHKSWLAVKDLDGPEIPDVGMTPFVMVMPTQYRGDDAVMAYRRYYVGAKHGIAVWSKRGEPEWYQPMRAEHVRLYGETETFMKVKVPKGKRKTKTEGKDGDTMTHPEQKRRRAKATKPELQEAIVSKSKSQPPNQSREPPTQETTLSIETRAMKRKASDKLDLSVKRQKL